jgi:glutathione synthase/RimK-type ligase-like ATP-grasp enzyme
MLINATSTDPATVAEQACKEYTGLAPVLRMSINGGDLRGLAQLLLEAAGRDENDANLWMNLSTAMFALQLQGPATSVQQQALDMQRTYTRAASQPTRFRLLMLMAPGNLAENTPLDCLLEDSAVELVCHFVSPDALLPMPLPDHDALLVAFSDSEVNSPLLARLVPILDQWHRPVINRPAFIANTERSRASELLQGVPGLAMPLTYPMSRDAAVQAALANGSHCGPAAFPIIVRPVGSQAGHDLDRIEDAEALAAYLLRVEAPALYVSPFIDYSGADGQFRKIRVALVDGVPYVSHMAVSAHWMVHYLNAGMYEDAAKRREEEAFMDRFDEFAQRHASALRAIHERSGLDYLCIDCAETRDGELLIFEIDHVMVVHAMDSLDLFPFKHVHMAKLRHAFEDYLYRLRAAATTSEAS